MTACLPSDDLSHIVQQTTQSVWDDLDSARIFITGGTGFFGIWLLESLLFAKKYLDLQTQMVVLSRDPSGFLKKFPHLQSVNGLTWVQGEVQDFAFPAGPFTHVIHAATPASAALNQHHPLLMFDTIVQGTRRVLEFTAYAGADKYLLTSSGAVYGPQPPHLSHVTEEYLGVADPLQAGSAYAGGKWMAEHLTHTFGQQYGFSAKIARCFAFVGPYLPLNTHFAIGNFMQNALQQAPICLHGDGTPYRSYLYAADLMIWLWTLLCHGQSGRAYNVGSEQAINLGDLANLMARQVDPQVPVVIATQPNPSQLPTRYIPSTQRAQQELGLRQKIDLVDGIQRTLNWLKVCTNKN